MAEQTYGDWIRSNPPRPTKRYKKEHMAQQNQIGDTKEMVTALEWLYGIMFVKKGAITLEEYQHALEMNKHQHDNTWDAAIKAHDDRGGVHARSLVDFDEWYEEQFKK